MHVIRAVHLDTPGKMASQMLTVLSGLPGAEFLHFLWKDIQYLAAKPAEQVGTIVVIGGALYIVGLALQVQVNLISAGILRWKLRNARNRKRRECQEALARLEEEISHSKVRGHGLLIPLQYFVHG